MSTHFLLAQATPPTTNETITGDAQGQAPATGSGSTMTQAPGSPATTQGDGGTGNKSPFDMFMIPLMIVVFIMLFILPGRAKKKQEAKHKEMLETLKRGDRVMTIGGIMGTVVEASAEKVLLKVDETSNTKISFSRRAIDRVISTDSKSAE